MALEIDKIREIAERVAASSGLEVVEVELRGGGKARMLRIVIDKLAGVTHEDCASVSREVGTILDVEDVISGVVHAGSFFARTGPEINSSGRLRALHRKPDQVDHAATGQRQSPL